MIATPKPVSGTGFGNDQLQTRFVEAPHRAIQVRGRFPKILRAAQMLDETKSFPG